MVEYRYGSMSAQKHRQARICTNSTSSPQNVSLRLKDNNKGVGFEGHDDTWLAHQSDFQVNDADGIVWSNWFLNVNRRMFWLL